MAALDNYSIRKAISKKRQQLEAAVYASYSNRIFKLLQQSSQFQKSQTIGLYCSVKQEVDTMCIIKALLKENKQVALPCVLSKTEMVFRKIKSIDDLQIGKFGIYAPKDTCPIIKTMDMLIVPLVAFNQQGYRLGMGGGYYDRYLHKYPQYTCGLAFSFQAHEFEVFAHDLKLNEVITEGARLTFK